MTLTFWIVVLAFIALVGLALLVCAVLASGEPVRRGGYVTDRRRR